MPRIRLADPRVGSLYAIPASAWYAIYKRVELVLFAAPAASTIAQSIPPFPALVTSCGQWKNATFPSIKSQSRELARYASSAITDFTSLKNEIAAHTPNVLADARTAITRLSASTRDQQTAFAAITANVVDFVNRNGDVDAIIGRNVERMGPEWSALNAESATLSSAAGAVRGGWGAIDDDLRAAANEQFHYSMEFLLELDIDSALLAWRNIEERSAAFTSQVAA